MTGKIGRKKVLKFRDFPTRLRGEVFFVENGYDEKLNLSIINHLVDINNLFISKSIHFNYFPFLGPHIRKTALYSYPAMNEEDLSFSVPSDLLLSQLVEKKNKEKLHPSILQLDHEEDGIYYVNSYSLTIEEDEDFMPLMQAVYNKLSDCNVMPTTPAPAHNRVLPKSKSNCVPSQSCHTRSPSASEIHSFHRIFSAHRIIENKESVERLFDNFFVISETPVTRLGKMYMELLFNNLIRFVGEDFSPLSSDQCKEFPTDCCVCQDVLGEYSISTYISMDHDTAIKFASRYVNDSFTEYDEYVQASLEDFLNLNNGLFIVNCSNDYGRELSISAPRHVDDGLLSFKDKAYHFQILYTFGTIHFIVEVHKLIEEY